ncbi:MAG TPA: hypothetical protein VJS42_22795 [Steroidobacteraceae bacterium]|nr:hypothetical protein [Steroidobacteraceae bacterium]
MVWYGGQFYALFFLEKILQVDPKAAKLIMAGCLLAVLTYFPVFKGLTHYANPALERAVASAPVTVLASAKDCSFQFDPVGKAAFTRSCDVAKSVLAKAGLFPTRIRYTSMSLPYHIGNGWFGGFLPVTSFAIVAATGNIYNGLWYPIAVAAMTVVIGTLFLRETKDAALE